MELHLEWSIEENGTCPDCGEEPALIAPHSIWREVYYEEYQRETEPAKELTGEYCFSCRKLLSLYLND